jgi:hypothetical protein
LTKDKLTHSNKRDTSPKIVSSRLVAWASARSDGFSRRPHPRRGYPSTIAVTIAL